MKNLFQTLRVLYTIITTLLVIVCITYAMSPFMIENGPILLSGDVVIYILAITITFTIFSMLYFFLRLDNSWIETHTELEEKITSMNKVIKTYKDAKEIIDKYTIEKYGLTVKEIDAKLNQK